MSSRRRIGTSSQGMSLFIAMRVQGQAPTPLTPKTTSEGAARARSLLQLTLIDLRSYCPLNIALGNVRAHCTYTMYTIVKEAE